MSYLGFRFTGRNAVTVRPADKPAAVGGDTWARDRSSAGANDGTEIDATWLNRVKANIERAVLWLTNDTPPATGDDQLRDALAARFGAVDDAVAAKAAAADVNAALAGKVATGAAVSVLADGGGFVRMTDAERAKLASLAVNYMGVFASLAALETAHPAAGATAGSWAILTHGAGVPATFAALDSDNAPPAWIDTGAGAPTTIDWASVTGKPSTFVTSAADIGDASANGRSLLTAADYAAMRGLLDLEPGTDVQAYDADLAAIAAFAPTKGRILVGDGAAWQVLAAGTNGHALVADSAEATGLKYASAAGGITEIASSTISSGVASVEFSGAWSYKRLTVVGFGLSGNSAVAALRVQISDDDGATYETVDFAYSYYDSVGTAVYTARTTSNVVTVLTDPNNLGTADDDHAFRCAIFDANGAASRKTVDATGASYDSTAWTSGIGVTAAACAAINRIKITYTSGNLDAGVIKLYGE